MDNKLTTDDRIYLDSLISFKSIMSNSKKIGSNELLCTYIKGVVLPLLDKHNITYEKKYEKILEKITNEIKRLTPKSTHKNFHES